MQGNSRKSSPREVYDELLHSLEQARSRLAVAIATESKATPLERIRYYRETDEKVHRCVRELRSLRRSGVEGRQGLQEALSALKRLPPEYFVARQGHALQLCQQLREALASLEPLNLQKSESE